MTYADDIEDIEFSPEELAALDAWQEEERRQERIHRVKAAWMLLTATQGDCEQFDLVERVTMKFLCLICLAMIWRAPPSERLWETYSMAAWDFTDDGYFWNEWYLDFNPRAFRVSIFRDGDGESPY